MEINKSFIRKAVLAAVNVNIDDKEFKVLIDETINLCQACNIEVIHLLIQKSRNIDPNTAFRKGKLKELGELVKNSDVNCVVFYNNLSISMLARISKACQVEIIDRTNLILDIFAMRAKSRESIIQTQIARLKYDLPKLYLIDMDIERQRGGSDLNRGAGETKIEIARRKIEGQISDLNKELQRLKLNNNIKAKKRNNSGLKSVALVGYSNAGKSSLMNYILKNNQKNENKYVFEEDMLFATLDTSVRKITHKNHEFLLYDTVGFVSNLPHELIEAFKSTLSAAEDADLLIHVIDGSDKLKENQKEVTYATLKSINADEIPVIEVYNKADKLNERDFDLRYISCLNGEGIEKLLDKIIDTLYPKIYHLKLSLPYEAMYLLDRFKNHYEIVEIKNTLSGSDLILKADEFIKENLKVYLK